MSSQQNQPQGPHSPIREYFAEALRQAFRERLGLENTRSVEAYIAEVLVRFIHRDAIYAIRDSEGRRLESIAEMMAEGDVRVNAESFEREREVHRHIGDFLLFWCGLFPERLEAGGSVLNGLIDPLRQGSESYFVVSTFDQGRYADEAPIFRRLSVEFDAYILGLNLLRGNLRGDAANFGLSA